MASPLRVVTVLMAIALLIGAATPPVIEDHLEAGFCSADCPIQHAGHTTAIAPPPAPSAGGRSPAAIIVGVRRADAARSTTGASDAPRAPPAA